MATNHPYNKNKKSPCQAALKLWLEELHKQSHISQQLYLQLQKCIATCDSSATEWLETQNLVSPLWNTINVNQLLRWQADRLKKKLIVINPQRIDLKNTAELIPAQFARYHQILVLSTSQQTVTVACGEPFAIDQWYEELQDVLKKEIIICLAHPRDIRIHLATLYSLHHSIINANNPNDTRINLNTPDLLRLDIDPENASAEMLSDRLLRYALEQDASDIHIEPREKHSCIRLRIHGILHSLILLPVTAAAILVQRLKILANMDTTEKRRPQDGHLRIQQTADNIMELRLSTLPTAFGEKLVLRFLHPQRLKQHYQSLGMSIAIQQHWQAMLDNNYGLILVTGPTNSGKTTTLYNALYQLDDGRKNICTAEDPIEIIEPKFNQTQVQHNLGLGFDAVIRALMRQDPDIIMVGEIRDQATAKAAIQAALTGHQVLASLHTENALGAIPRLIDIGVPAYLIRATINGVLGQRLLPRLCHQCKQPCASSSNSTIKQYRATGCMHCRQSGIDGRIGVFETFVADYHVRQRISDTGTIMNWDPKVKDAKRYIPLSHSIQQQLALGLIDNTSIQISRDDC